MMRWLTSHAQVYQTYKQEIPPTPFFDLAIMKGFVRFSTLGSDGRLNPRMTAESFNSRAERFFAGFTTVAGSINILNEK